MLAAMIAGDSSSAMLATRQHIEAARNLGMQLPGGYADLCRVPHDRYLVPVGGMDPARALRMRQDLQTQLNSLGLTADKEIITHCQTHHRSGFTYLAAKVLGYPRVKAYAGSWGEWGNHPDTPVER